MHFTNYTFPQYVADPVHELIAATLDQVVEGASRRVMIFAPPQHGKSELVSVRLPAFWLGRRPDDPVILTSYAASLADSKSRLARNLVESDEFARLFSDLGTPRDSRAVNEWSIAGRRGGLLAAGVGGPITGHGAQLGLIDDPLENWEQAQSQTYRDRVWDWYRSTFRTRIWESGAIVLVMTRWHEDDLAGRLLADQGALWTVLRLPALAETQEERDENNKRLGQPIDQPDPLGRVPGEPLSPRRFSSESLGAIKRDVGSLVWNGEYQGSPRAPEGNRFKREWFKIVDAAPELMTRIRYWDKASTEGGGKFSAGVLIGRTPERQVFIEHVARGQWSTGHRRSVMLQTAQLDAERFGNTVHIYIEQEPGSSGKDSVDDEILLLGAYPVHADRPTGDKDTRLEPFVAQAEAGNVRLVRGAWNAAYIDEMCAIPSGTYRDQADATAGGYNKLARELTGKLVY